MPETLNKPRVVIGHHACEEVKKVRPGSILEIWCRAGHEKASPAKDWIEWAKRNGVKTQLVGAPKLNELGQGHQNMAVLTNEIPSLNWSKLKSDERGLVMILDEIEDPHNLGAIVRSTWVAGGDAVIVTERRSASMTPTVAKVACGGVEHIPIEVSSNLLSTFEDLKEAGFWIFGLAPEARGDVWEQKLPEKVAWVVGAEDKGLRTSTRQRCDELVSLQQISASMSYNASVAASLAIFETLRQWKVIEKSRR